MRVVRVAPRAEGTDESFALHAQLTVFRGLRGRSRSWLVETIGLLDGARAAEARGELEAAGVLLPIEPGTLGLLGIDDAARGVIDARRLLGMAAEGSRPPSTTGDEAGAAASEAAPAEPIDPVDSWFNEPADDADHGSDPTDDRPGQLVAEVPAPATALDRRITALRERRFELERLADAITVTDVTGVDEALAAWDAAPTGVPVEEAAALADAWRDLQTDLKGLDLGASADEKAALDRVARAHDAVAEAEAALLVPQLTDDQMARIEAAHAAYIEASDKVERRFGGARARRQLTEAEAEETRLLSRFGFESWVDFMLTASKRTEDPEMMKEQADLEAAKVELEVCIGELDAIPGALGRRRRRSTLREREAELSEKVARMLGHEPVGDDVESELRTVKAPYEPVAEAAELVRALERVGADVADLRREPVRLAAKAHHLLAVHTQAEKRRSELLVAVDALAASLVELERAVDEGATEVPPMPPLPDMAEPPVAYVDSFDHEDPQEIFGLFDAPGDEADVSDEGDAGDAGDAGGEPGSVVATGDLQASPASDAGGSNDEPVLDEPVVDDVDVDLRKSMIDYPDRAALVDDVHWEAMMAIADLRRDGPAGQLPVVFDDPFTMLAAEECIEVLSRLVRLTDHVQMVVVSDRPEVAEWAEAIGPEHASVVEVAR